MILRHTFTPHDNHRLSHLCGPADAHLRTIEDALGVKIAHRHEQFKIDGPKAKANEALELLQALYEMAIDPIAEDVLQLMLAGDAELVEDITEAIPLMKPAHRRLLWKGIMKLRRREGLAEDSGGSEGHAEKNCIGSGVHPPPLVGVQSK